MFETVLCKLSPLKVDSNKLTIGMAAYGNAETTTHALHALFASVSGKFELILVDDASADDTLTLFESVAEQHPNTKIFRLEKNIEYSGSLNLILSHAKGESIIFLSNDIFVTPAYIKELLSISFSMPEAGIIRGCSNFVDNGLPLHTIKDCGELDNFDDLFAYAAQRALKYAGRTVEDPFLTGDAFMVTRSVLDRIGFIDQRFFGYFADHDFGVRARQAGFSPQLALGAFAWHQHASNMDYLPDEQKQAKIQTRWARANENWARFKDKYGIPASMPYTGMRRIPWDGLAADQSLQKKIIPPGDYSANCLPQPNSDGWPIHKAIQASRRARKLMESANLSEAEQLCKAALVEQPDCSELLNVLGVVQVYQGRVVTGIKNLRLSVSADPDNVKAHSNLLLSMHYHQGNSDLAILRESKRWAALHAEALTVTEMPVIKRSRIRVAYISPDFRRHSVSSFFMPLLSNHNRERFEIFCISDVATPDAITAKMVALADGWRDISGMNDSEAETVIREVAPDILIDLTGHTGHQIRLPLISKRLAPIQINWLGYPGTTGLSQIDYRLTDAVADPVGIPDRYHTEKLFRLSNGFLCYRPLEEAPEVSELPAFSNGYVTFGCFNILPKIQDVMIDAWCSILKLLPESSLILKNHFLRDTATANRMRRKFKSLGISGERLELLPSDVDIRSHLSQYSRIDIALDTYPYAGTTTTCEALWQGVPVVSLCGNRHASRVGLSIMRQLGHEEFVAKSIEQYCDIACSMARDLDSLQDMRQLLRFEMYDSPLCDEEAFTKSVEAFFEKCVASV